MLRRAQCIRVIVALQVAAGFNANGPQGTSPHGWVLFGEKAASAPLYAHHGAGSLNTHRYDASWRLRLLDSNGADITAAVQQARAEAAEGEAFWLGCCGSEPFPSYLLPQLAGSYFDQPKLTRVDNLPLYRGYNPPNAEGSAAFKAAGKPVQRYSNGTELPTVPGPLIFAAVTAIFEQTIIFRSFDQIDPPPSSLTYHLLGTNSKAFLQHRISGFGSSWSQVLPVTLAPGLIDEMEAMPNPAETTLAADGTYLDTTAMRTLDVAHGSCLLRVPSREDNVEARLSGGDEVDVEVECLYYCSTAEPRRCLNDFEPIRSLSNNGLFPTVTFRTRIVAGVEQGLLSDNLLMLPGGPSLVSRAAMSWSQAAGHSATAPDPATARTSSPTSRPSFFAALAATAACVLIGAVAAWLALRSVGSLRVLLLPEAGGAPLTPRARERFKRYERDEAEERGIKARAGRDPLELIETPSSVDALYDGPRSDQPEATPHLLAAARPIVLAITLGTLAALLGAAALSSSGSSGGQRYLAGTIMAPFHPNSHVFTHGFESPAQHEYSITMLRLPAPAGEQTHEIYFDEGSHTAFVTVVTSSRLMQIPFDVRGKLHDHVREWTVGHPVHNPHPEEAGLHNIAHSTRFPGMLWIATETDDRVYLVDPSHGFAIKYALHTPTTLVTATGEIHYVGGPHSVREGPDGTIWVALKGSNYDGPGYDDPAQAEYYKNMMDEHFLAEGEHVPDGWAVWHVDPELYDASIAPARGGVLHPALESPTMTAIDGKGNAWTTQDRSPTILHVSTDGVATQVALPSIDLGDEVWGFSNGNGPGIATSPDGSVWLSNLGQRRPWLVRFLPGSTDPLIFKDLMPDSDSQRELFTIHMAFSSHAGPRGDINAMYVLTSSLLSPQSAEAVIVQEFDETWSGPRDGEVGHQEIILPTANSAAHRLTVAETTRPRSILVTGLLSNTLYQISGNSI